MRRFRLRGGRLTTPSVVVSMSAVFVALAGTGWAKGGCAAREASAHGRQGEGRHKRSEAAGPHGGGDRGHPGPGTDAATLTGRTAAQIAATPGPTGTLAGGLFTIRSTGWSIELQAHRSTPVRSVFQVNARSTAVGTRLWALRRSRPIGRYPTAQAGSSRSSQRVATTVPVNGSGMGHLREGDVAMSTYERKEHPVRRFRIRGIRVTPPLVVSMIALFVALAGTGWLKRRPARQACADGRQGEGGHERAEAAGPHGSPGRGHPGPATDAATLNGQTAAQIAATPGPTGSLSASLFSYRTQSFSVDSQGATARDTALCLSGEKAIGGGWEKSSGLATVTVDRPMPDGSGWRFHIFSPRAATTSRRAARSTPSAPRSR